MKRISRIIGACLLASLWMTCAAQQPVTRPAPKDPPATYGPQKLKDITPSLIEQVGQYARFRRVLFTDPMNCTYDANGSCPILIQILQVTDTTGSTPGTYCVGLLPSEVHLAGTGSANPPKRLVWSLVLPSTPIANAKFYFYEEKNHGITVLSDVKAQIHTGSRGDGVSTGTPDPMKYNAMNRHKVKGTAVYVPIVLKEDTVTHEISLCGTPDPRILND